MDQSTDSGLDDTIKHLQNISEFSDFYNTLGGFIFDTEKLEETEKKIPEKLQIFRRLAQNMWQIKSNKDLSVDELKTTFDYGYSDFLELRRSQRLKRNSITAGENVEEKPKSYIRLKKNQDKRSKTSRNNSYVEYKSKCVCDEKNPCLNSNCYNRMRQIECLPKTCNVDGKLCENRRFQKYHYPELNIQKLPEKEWSLFAEENIERGAFVIEYVGEVINKTEYDKRLISQQRKSNDNNYYMLRIDEFFIDASRKGNMARFINHSCKPNCEIQYWSVNKKPCIGVFALFDIPMGTEITINYTDWKTLIKKKLVCHCKEPQCFGFIGAGRINTNPEEGESSKRKATDDDESSDDSISESSFSSFSKRSKRNNSTPSSYIN